MLTLADDWKPDSGYVVRPRQVLLHCGKPVHGEAATRLRAQIAKASSSNATTNRRFASSSTASS
jgi:hypothetical protein